jgi:hypothetical protein
MKALLASPSAKTKSGTQVRRRPMRREGKYSLGDIFVEMPRKLSQRATHATVQRAANKGDVAEGILGAAIVAQFLSPSENITAIDVISVIQQLNANKNMSRSKTVVKEKIFGRKRNPEVAGSKGDRIRLRVGLSVANFKAFTDVKYLNQVPRLINSAVKFASSPAVMNHVQQTYNDPNANIIEVLSVGTENQRGTKIDLRIVVDGKPVRAGAISLKTGSTTQLGQIGKSWSLDETQKKSVRGIVDLFKTLFDVEVDDSLRDEYISALKSASRDNILKAVNAVYEDAFDKIDSKFEGDEEELMHFFLTLTNGIQYEATLREKGVVLVQLSKGEFKYYDYNRLSKILQEPENDIEVQVEFHPGGGTSLPYIYVNVYLNTHFIGSLVSVRPKIRFKGERLHEFRHYVQKGRALDVLLSLPEAV